MAFTSPRERQLWTVAGVYFAGILASAYRMRAVVDALRANGLLSRSFWALAAIVATGLLVAALRSRPVARHFVVLVAVGAGYLLAFHQLTRIEERLHLFEYGLLAVLIEAALRERRPTPASPEQVRASSWPPFLGWPAIQAGLLTTTAGWVDELVQGALPNRYHDLRDVGFNGAAAVLALTALAAWRWATPGGGHPPAPTLRSPATGASL